MLKVVETFSGIGSQAKALKNIGIEHEVVNTVDWDINAIYAYDILHNGPQDLTKVDELKKHDLVELLDDFDLSSNGKEPLSKESLNRMTEETLKKVYAAILRTKNLVNIQRVTAKQLPEDFDLLTYSFPCQDLSISGFWHGNAGGIERDSNNRSSMLWEIERILLELNDLNRNLPRFLLMENVAAIRSDRHIDHFNEWQEVLESLGYVNQVYDLYAEDFGIPQMRKRTFMLSVQVGKEDVVTKNKVKEYFEKNNLETYSKENRQLGDIKKFLRMDYSNKNYLEEALISIPNDTESRRRIHEDNPTIYNKRRDRINQKAVRTITTKQDRHPNSGVIEHDIFREYNIKNENKSMFRYLTPRECFLFMGFDETDYERLINNNFNSRKNTKFLSRDKLNKLAGNSIVVDVLEAVFKQLHEIDETVLPNNNK